MEVLEVLKTIRNYILIVIIAYGVYFVLDHHFLFQGKNVYLLKKSEPSLKYTFFNMTDKKSESILRIDALRQDGVGNLLVELELITEEKKNNLEAKFDAEAE